MGRAYTSIVALTAALSLIALSLPALAQDSPERDAAIARCIAQAHTQYPGSEFSQMANRTAVYKACMVSAGFRP